MAPHDHFEGTVEICDVLRRADFLRQFNESPVTFGVRELGLAGRFRGGRRRLARHGG